MSMLLSVVAGQGGVKVPGAPGTLSLSNGSTSGTMIDLSWSAPSDTGGGTISGYRIKKDGSTLVADTGSTGTTYTATGLTRLTEYNFNVAAINEEGTGADGNTPAHTTTAEAPGAPGTLSLSAGSPAQTVITLSWSAPADTGGATVTGYRIKKDGSVLVADTGSTGTTYSATGLSGSTSYNFNVAAINSIGTGADGNTPSLTTSAYVAVSSTTGSPTEVNYGNTKAFTFTSSGSLTFSVGGEVTVWNVAGGGSGGAYYTSQAGNGGGGAGGGLSYTVTVNTSGSKTVSVGNGGAGVTYPRGNAGGASSFGGTSTTGGGGGGGYNPFASLVAPTSGGSGGGGNSSNTAFKNNGASGVSGQGNSGGNGRYNNSSPYWGIGGGGGGGGGAGTTGYGTNNGHGGAGKANSTATGSSQMYCGGGGGGAGYHQQNQSNMSGGNGGTGGGGAGTPSQVSANGTSGTANTGGGGGACGMNTSGAGGTGVVVVSFTYQ